MATHFIRQLTGVRFVAAAWVVLFHFRFTLEPMGLYVVGLSEFLSAGFLGVDLFFALSGFILTYTYLSRLGPRFDANRAGRFLWLRLARIYPVHLVMLIVMLVAVLAKDHAIPEQSRPRDWITFGGFLQNLLLVQAWGPTARPGWNFVAWSLSMEWLAYLFFPFLVLVLWHLHRRFPVWALAGIWAVLMASFVIYELLGSGNWEPTVRIGAEFTAGAVTYLMVARLDSLPEARRRVVSRLAAVSAVVLPAAVVLATVLLGQLAIPSEPRPATDVMTEGYLGQRVFFVLVPMLVAWVGVLALSDGHAASWLSTRTLVLGGSVSYALYMTHTLCLGLWRAGMQFLGIGGGAGYAIGLLGLLPFSLLAAWATWRFIEEPARERLRGMVGERPVAVEEGETT